MTRKTAGFETERFTVRPLSPGHARKFTEMLLQDDVLAARVPWMAVKTEEGALREAYSIERQAAAGQIKVWGIVSKNLQATIGLIIARNALDGIDVEALVASTFWAEGVIAEAGAPVMDWLEEHAEEFRNFAISLH